MARLAAADAAQTARCGPWGRQARAASNTAPPIAHRPGHPQPPARSTPPTHVAAPRHALPLSLLAAFTALRHADQRLLVALLRRLVDATDEALARAEGGCGGRGGGRPGLLMCADGASCGRARHRA
jgi:hypothetical protein